MQSCVLTPPFYFLSVVFLPVDYPLLSTLTFCLSFCCVGPHAGICRSACAFFDVARLADFQPDMLIGADAQFFSQLPPPQQYLYSMFWALSTLSSAEFSADAPGSVPATVSATLRALLFMAFNIGVYWWTPVLRGVVKTLR